MLSLTGVTVANSKKKKRRGKQSSDETYNNANVNIPTATPARLSTSEPAATRNSVIYSLPDRSDVQATSKSALTAAGSGDGYSYAVSSLASPINPVEVDFTQGYECASPSATLPSHYEVPVASGSVKVARRAGAA